MPKNSLPTITSAIPRDLRLFLDRLRDMVLKGELGGEADSATTAKVATQAESLKPGNTPPSVVNFAASPVVDNVLLSWDASVYSDHSHTEIWGHDTDSIGDAVLLGITSGKLYTDNLGHGASRYYWARQVSHSDVRGAFNAVAGTLATTVADLAHTLETLSDTYGGTSAAPFFQIDTSTVINGETIPAGTYMKAAFIHNAAITNAQIKDLSADKILASSIVADNAYMQAIQSALIESDNAYINVAHITDLTVDMADVTGTLNADRIEGGTLSADVISGDSISGLDIDGNNITGATITSTDITASSITATVITSSILTTSAAAQATEAGLPHAGYTIGVTDSTTASTSGGSWSGVALNIKPYNYYITTTSTTIDHTSNQWRYRRQSVSPSVSGSIDVTSASNSYYDEYRNVLCGRVQIQIYTASSGGSLVASAVFELKVVAHAQGTRTLTASNGGFSFTLTYGLDQWDSSDGWTTWNYNKINTQDVQFSVSGSHNFNDSDSLGMFAQVRYYDVQNGLGLGTKNITISDTAENDY